MTTRAGCAGGGGGGIAGWAGAGAGGCGAGWLGLGVVVKGAGVAPGVLASRACQSLWMASTKLAKSRITAQSSHTTVRTCMYHGHSDILAKTASVAYDTRAEGELPTKATNDP